MVGYYLLLKHFVKIVVFVDPLDLCDHFFFPKPRQRAGPVILELIHPVHILRRATR